MARVALTIAGSDPSGGAGIQADLKTFHQRGVYGTSVVTSLTVQNTQRFDALECVSADLVLAQLEAVLEDIPPQAAKTGALGSLQVVRAIAERAEKFDFPLVVDPVMISKSGASLLDAEGRRELVRSLVPRAFLVTPNIPESSLLADIEVTDAASMQEAARRIAQLGARAVLVKGGHLEGEAVDVLLFEGAIHHFSSRRIQTRHTHGTGCTFSAAITAELAKGRDLVEAVRIGKEFITRAIESNPSLGKGFGPVNHHARIDVD